MTLIIISNFFPCKYIHILSSIIPQRRAVKLQIKTKHIPQALSYQSLLLSSNRLSLGMENEQKFTGPIATGQNTTIEERPNTDNC